MYYNIEPSLAIYPGYSSELNNIRPGSLAVHDTVSQQINSCTGGPPDVLA